MSELDWFGHWGYAFILVGQYYVGCKEPMGWLFRFFGEALWIIIGAMLGMSSIWVWGFIFMALDVHNYGKWRDEERKKEEYELYLDQALWLRAGAEAMEKVDEDIKRESEGPKVAAKRSRSRAKKVQSTRRRRSVKTNGKRRSRSNDVARSSKKGRRKL